MAGEHQVLEALYRAYNGHDADAAASLYTAGGHHEDVATQRVQRSPEAIAVGLRGFLDAFPDATGGVWESRATTASSSGSTC